MDISNLVKNNRIGANELGDETKRFFIVTDARMEHSEKFEKENIIIGVSEEENGEPCDLWLNRSSLKSLSKKFGNDTSAWIGKKIKAFMVCRKIRDENIKMLMVEPDE